MTITCMTYADVLRPAARHKALFYDIALTLCGSLLIALSGRVWVILPFSPIPVTAQTLGVLLTGTLLGSRRGSLAVLAFLLQGALGLPVFQGGNAGLAHLAGPSGGYLLGFVVAAYTTGRLAQRGWDRSAGTMLLAMLIGNSVLYAFGLTWLSLFVGFEQALPLGFYPFILGDLVKIALATASLPASWRWLGRATR